LIPDRRGARQAYGGLKLRAAVESQALENARDLGHSAFGVHAFFVFKWFQGQKALKDLNDPDVSTV